MGLASPFQSSVTHATQQSQIKLQQNMIMQLKRVGFRLFCLHVINHALNIAQSTWDACMDGEAHRSQP